MKILLRLDADHHVGLAHAIRVAKILSLVKPRPEIHLIGNLPHCEQFFEAATPVTSLSPEAGSEQDRAFKVVEIADCIGADVLLIDQPHLSQISWDIFADSGLPVIAIDDEGGPVRADLVFNGTILPAYHHYPLIADETCIHNGADYALINPCFSATPWSEPAEPGLLSVIGSGDRACTWALALTGPEGPFSRLEVGRKTMVVGAAYPVIDQLGKNCKAGNITLHQGLDQPAMARMFSQHSVGLITGGMIVYETLATGLPVIVFPQEKNLPPETQFFAGKGSLIDLGYDGGMDMELVHQKIKNLMYSREKRLKLSGNARQIIDGKGMLRTIEALDLFFHSLQENVLGEEQGS